MAHNQGVYWEKGAMQGCYILFRDGNTNLCVGTEEIDMPKLLIKSNSYFYLSIQSADNGSPYDYYVVEDFDGPLKLRHSGYVYESEDQRIILL